MNWIRVATGMKNDPDIAHIAEACRVRVAEVVGCVTSLLSELPEHAREGDLTNVPDTLLEQWAGWEGKRGLFAKAFIAHLCIDRTVRSWEKHNGAALRESDRARERVREWRANKKEPDTDAEPPPKRTRNVRRSVRGTEGVTNGVANGERTLLRDGTGITTTTANAVAVVSGDRERVQKIRDRFTEPEHIAAFDRHLRAHHVPDAFVLELESLTRDRPSDGAPGLAWPVIGQALHELSLGGARADAARIRIFADTVMRRERGEFANLGKGLSAAGDPTWDDLISREEAPAHVE